MKIKDAWIGAGALIVAAVVTGIISLLSGRSSEVDVTGSQNTAVAVVQEARDVTINQTLPSHINLSSVPEALFFQDIFVINLEKGGSAKLCKNDKCIEIKVKEEIKENGLKYIKSRVLYPGLESCPQLKDIEMGSVPIGIGKRLSISRPEIDFVAEILDMKDQEITLGVSILKGTNKVSLARLNADGTIIDIRGDCNDKIWLRLVAVPGKFDNRNDPGPFPQP